MIEYMKRLTKLEKKNDLKNLLYYNEISDEIDNICNKYI